MAIEWINESKNKIIKLKESKMIFKLKEKCNKSWKNVG